MQLIVADPPVIKTITSLHSKLKEAMTRLKGEKAAGICNFGGQFLKAGDEAVIYGLLTVVTAV